MCIDRKEYYSAIKKEWNSAVCRKVDDPRKYPYSMKLNQTKTILYDITYMWNLKYDTNEVTYLQKRNKAWEHSGCGIGGEMAWKFGISSYKVCYSEWIHKVLPYSTRTIFNIL